MRRSSSKNIELKSPVRRDAGQVVVQIAEEEGDVATDSAAAETEMSWIIESIKEKIRKPKDCNTSSTDSFTIGKVNSNIGDGNKDAYTPKLVSIGPYHYNNENFKEMQDVKFEYLNDLFQRSCVPSEDTLSQYITAVSNNAELAMKQYSNALNLECKEFVMMMVVDGCFLTEFLLKSYLNDKKDQTNTVKSKMPLLMNDLLLVENQIPFFILENLLKVYTRLQNSGNTNNSSFTISLLALFCFTGDRLYAEVAANIFAEKKIHHLLHLYHSSLNPNHDRSRKGELEWQRIKERINSKYHYLFYAPLVVACFFTLLIAAILKVFWNTIVRIILFILSKLWDCIRVLFLLPLSISFQFMTLFVFNMCGGDVQWTSGIPNARYLRNTGFVFRKKDTSCIYETLDVTYSWRKIRIPVLCIQETTTIHFKNLIALEHSSKIYGSHFTAFAKFMDYLIDTEEDVAILRESGIIDNRLGKDEMVANFFNNLLNGVHIEDDNVPMFHYVRKYYTNYCYMVKFFQWRKKLIPEYFSNPWAVPSKIAAFIILVLTVLQTFYTIYQYYKGS